MADWTERFVALAEHIATWSKDPSTQVGAVVVNADRQVLATGYNGFPRGLVDDPALLADRDYKYRVVVHAEENALLQAARTGVTLHGASLYTSLAPCSKCARLIIQSGIRAVYYREQVEPERWAADFAFSRRLLVVAGVHYVPVAAC